MNTSANDNQLHATVKFRRRTMGGTLLVTSLTSIAIGFAATSHADDDAPNPGTDTAIVVPAPPLPPPPPAVPWLEGFLDRAFHPHLHCGHRGSDYRCDWY
jgi:hypothetical protein